MKPTKENQQLNQYMEEFEEDTKLNLQNLREKSLTVSMIRAKWLNYFFLEKENLERANAAKAKYIKSKSASGDSVLRLKNEDNLMSNDDTLAKLKRIAAQSQANMEYLQMALNILDGFGYQIKTVSEILKLEKI